MKLNEKKVEEVLFEVLNLARSGYNSTINAFRDKEFISIMGKVETLLTILEFEEGKKGEQ